MPRVSAVFVNAAEQDLSLLAGLYGQSCALAKL